MQLALESRGPPRLPAKGEHAAEVMQASRPRRFAHRPTSNMAHTPSQTHVFNGPAPDRVSPFCALFPMRLVAQALSQMDDARVCFLFIRGLLFELMSNLHQSLFNAIERGR